MRKTIASLAIAAFLAAPTIGFADTSLIDSIQSLLAEVTKLKSAMGAAAASALPDDYGSGDQGYCPKLSRTLQRGSTDARTGGEVTELQLFLANYYDLDENTSVSGYFGAVTARNVIRFQKEQGLPALGIAGSLTRAAISRMCGGSNVQPATPVTPASPVTETVLTISSISPRTVTVLYTNMPVGGYINLLWLNKNNQYEATGQGQVPQGGTGSIVIDVPENSPSGTYKAQARKMSDMYWSAESGTFVIQGVAAALNCTVTASPLSASAGQYVTLTWTSLGANYAMWKQDSAATMLGLSGGKLLGNGSVTVMMPSTNAAGIIPTLQVYRDDGTSGACATTIRTAAAPQQTNPVVINSFTATPSFVSQGQSIQFNWSSNLSQTDISYYKGGCYIEGLNWNNAAVYVYAPTDASGSFTFTPQSAATYTLRCTSGGKDGSPSATKSAVVSVSFGPALPQCPSNAVAQRGQNGQTTNCFCPPGFSIKPTWGGPGMFTDDSDICSAGAMQGQMSQQYGGEVDYRIMEGQSSYPAYSFYGVTSQSRGAWPGSFAIVGPKG